MVKFAHVEMATKPNSFLRVIDESDTVNYAKWEQEKLDLETKYKQLCFDEREAVSLFLSSIFAVLGVAFIGAQKAPLM